MNARDMSPSHPDNPFQYIGPITDPSRAIPRSDAVAKVISSLQNHEYVSVLSPRQTGKTTFLKEVSRELQELQERSIYIDFEGQRYADLGELASDIAWRLRQLYHDHDKFTADLAEQLSLPLLAPEHFRARRQDALLALLHTTECASVVFLIDEIRSLGSLAVDFLQSVRAYYNESQAGRDSDSVHPHSFVISGSIDLADLTLEKAPELSPFNIAAELYLHDFGSAVTVDFILRQGNGIISEQSAERIFQYTCGQPYLFQQLSQRLYDLPLGTAEDQLMNFAGLIGKLSVEDSINLQSMVWHLWEDPNRSQDDLIILNQIMEGQRVPFDLSNLKVRRLYLLHGCIRDAEGYCAIRNPIYETVLGRNFRIYGQLASSRSETGAERRPREVAEYFEKLRPFDGWVLTSVLEAGKALPYDKESGFHLQKDSECILEVTLTTKSPPAKDTLLGEHLLIEGEEQTDDAIEYSIRPESFHDLGLDKEQTRLLPPGQDGLAETYRFPITTHQPTDGSFEIFLNIYQGASLVHVARLLVKVDN